MSEIVDCIRAETSDFFLSANNVPLKKKNVIVLGEFPVSMMLVRIVR